MTVYVVAQLRFTDFAAYRRYQAAYPPVFARFKAELLVADERVEVLEGDWPRDKLVLMEFPNEAEPRHFRKIPSTRPSPWIGRKVRTRWC
jgi:uncharacterized protein (DUF1330 family)